MEQNMEISQAFISYIPYFKNLNWEPIQKEPTDFETCNLELD